MEASDITMISRVEEVFARYPPDRLFRLVSAASNP
jgi:hypothetical protein